MIINNLMTPKVQGLKTWIATMPYWVRYLWKLHLEKEKVDDDDIQKCYQLLLEESGVNQKTESITEPLVIPVIDLDAPGESTKKTTIDKLDNLHHINALTDGFSVEFGKNLTIIYGDNGSGKSGIGRLLSNACLSRKPRKLLPDAKNTSFSATNKGKADFHISEDGRSGVINYTIGETHEVLKRFSVFDLESAPIHLNSENKVEFVPSKIKIFDDVFRSVSIVESRLKEETTSRHKDNPTEGLFTGSTKVIEFLQLLTHSTTDEKIDVALTFTVDDEESLSTKGKILNEKLKQDVSQKENELAEESAYLESFLSTLTTACTFLTKAKEANVNTLLQKIKEKRLIADKLSLKTFDFAAFKNVGSEEWKSLIKAAQKLYEKETTSNYGVVPSYCLLCRQGLGEIEKTLFVNYWEFLKSTAEAELDATKEELKILAESLETFTVNWPTFSETIVAIKILKRDIPEDLHSIQAKFDDYKRQVNKWVNCIMQESDVVYSDPNIDLSAIDSLIKLKKRTKAELVDPSNEIRLLNEQISYLQQKKQASTIVPKIKEYVAWLRWENATRMFNFPAIRSSITRKKTDIMDELVIARYIDMFNKETKALDCNFGLKVISRGREANTVKELRLEFAPGYNPSDILSEGEQTVSALADFLTEAKLSKSNSGLIFDDPVNSLDHLRKSVIARRLVEVAKEQQVIVLTHDIVFLLDLQSYAESMSVKCSSLSMRRIGNQIGVLNSELPWIAQDVKKRVGYLKTKLPELKKLENDDQDKYREAVKLWYGLLREAWERAVEERLFKGVIQRFNRSVQTQRLTKIDITKELITSVIDEMTQSSGWLHDLAAGVNPGLPDNLKLQDSINKLETFISKCKPD